MENCNWREGAQRDSIGLKWLGGDITGGELVAASSLQVLAEKHQHKFLVSVSLMLVAVVVWYPGRCKGLPFATSVISPHLLQCRVYLHFKDWQLIGMLLVVVVIVWSHCYTVYPSISNIGN